MTVLLNNADREPGDLTNLLGGLRALPTDLQLKVLANTCLPSWRHGYRTLMGRALIAEGPPLFQWISNYILGRKTTHSDSNLFRAAFAKNRRDRVEQFRDLFSEVLTGEEKKLCNEVVRDLYAFEGRMTGPDRFTESERKDFDRFVKPKLDKFRKLESDRWKELQEEMHGAICRGDLSRLKAAHELHLKRFGSSYFTTAMHRNKPEIMEFLLKRGFVPKGDSPFLAAIDLGHPEILDGLLKTCKEERPNKDLMELALNANGQRAEMAEALLRHGYTVEKRHLEQAFFALTSSQMVEFCLRGLGHTNVLDLAIAKGQKEAFKYLLENGASLDQGFYEAPLLAAAREGNLELFELLLEKGADFGAVKLQLPVVLQEEKEKCEKEVQGWGTYAKEFDCPSVLRDKGYKDACTRKDNLERLASAREKQAL